MNENNKKIALSLAKNSILEELWDLKAHNKLTELIQQIKSNNIKLLLEKKASFVTLKINWKELRWCIWSIVATRPLYEDIIINAKNAAFSDPRFTPLTIEELSLYKLFLEITILTEPKELKVKDIDQLIRFLYTHKPWLIIELDWRSATFLPSVWEQLPEPNEFLTHLIYKAWLDPKYFMLNFERANIYYYFWEEFGDWWNNID